MAYFKNYYDKLIELKDTIYSDVNSVEEDDRLVASMLHFAKEVGQLAAAAINNSAIEGKASSAPKVATHWWAGSGDEPNQ